MTMIHNAQATFIWHVPIFNVQKYLKKRNIPIQTMCFSHFITYVIHLNLLPGLTLYAPHKTLEISVMLWEVYEEGLNHMCIHYYSNELKAIKIL